MYVYTSVCQCHHGASSLTLIVCFCRVMMVVNGIKKSFLNEINKSKQHLRNLGKWRKCVYGVGGGGQGGIERDHVCDKLLTAMEPPYCLLLIYGFGEKKKCTFFCTCYKLQMVLHSQQQVLPSYATTFEKTNCHSLTLLSNT